MNHHGFNQKNTFASSGPVICPKPRRLSVFNPCSQSSEGQDSKAASELLDMIFAKDSVYETCTEIASSPPFFSGSPPSRVSNPLTQDARFGDNNVSPISPCSMIPNPASSSLQSSPSGCNRANFGNKPAVRIEGFDCLDRDNRSNCSIATLA